MTSASGSESSISTPPACGVRSPGPAPDRSAELGSASRDDFPLWQRLAWFGSWILLLMIWSWRKWPELLVDYGLQLYAPWQLASGKVLYRDVSYLAGGPLSQYFHALAFKLGGVSMTTLVLTNLCLLCGFTGLLYGVFLRAADRWTALMVCTVTLVVFSFSQYIGIGNYNFICPYTYETVHGLLLSVAVMACLYRWILRTSRVWAGLAGLCLGGVFLTKPDLFLAAFAAAAAAWVARATRGLGHAGTMGKEMGWLVAGALAPSAVFLIYFASVWELGHAFKAVTAAWLPVLTTSATHNEFYRWCLGLDEPWLNLKLMFQHSVALCAVLGYWILCARHLRGRNWVASVCLGAGVVILGYAAIDRVRWIGAGRALAPVTLIGCVWVGWLWWKRRKEADAAADKLLMGFLWGVFALVLLAKMGLHTRLWHYGYYLAMPAAAFVILLAAWILPRECERFQVRPEVMRVLVGLFLVIASVQLVARSSEFYLAKSFSIGAGGDRILVLDQERNGAGYAVDQAMAWIRAHTAGTNTLATLPEGVMINYLTRRANPAPYVGFTLPEIQAYGEAGMVEAYDRHRPDYIVLVHRESGEYGVGYFGAEPGFGYDMMHWVRTHYEPVWLIGHEPLQTNRFGVMILRRTDLDPLANPSSL